MFNFFKRKSPITTTQGTISDPTSIAQKCKWVCKELGEITPEVYIYKDSNGNLHETKEAYTKAENKYLSRNLIRKAVEVLISLRVISEHNATGLLYYMEDMIEKPEILEIINAAQQEYNSKKL